jgi:putative acetyltransferase
LSQSSRTIELAKPDDLPRLFEVWESSVRATHAFLGEQGIQFLVPLVKAELSNFGRIHCLRNKDGKPFAFLAVADAKIEMLFVHADYRGSGAGCLLSEFAIRVLNADSVDVNEDNDQAIGFYLHLGFRQVSRSRLDATGRPFPILNLALKHPSSRRPLLSPLSVAIFGAKR